MLEMMEGPFSRVDVLIKTFLRDGHLTHTVQHIQRHLKGARMVIVDDGERKAVKRMLYERLANEGHVVILMPFDSGFGAKSNEAIAHYTRPYVLVASDDFDFSDGLVPGGILKMMDVLDHDPQVAIASGRVNGTAYEGMLSFWGKTATETWCEHNQPLFTAQGTEYHRCDLTVNYSLMRREILGMDKIHWDSDVKIGGGEHGAFFIDVKRAGHGVAWVPGAEIKEQPHDRGNVHPMYGQYRARAKQPGRICLRRRGILRYICFDGTVDLT